ncbi:BQ5605_C050g12476 [Microbotryum silenes-dioicae]|uniref:BQ5605_C050g12476 protein n=1 Tax=Microbotryum silenes-dioicae TaxID=796604 RepID=A0A2X0NGL1_9BASI|nr:BQ5605_C050g12476 [Microbotryum silenes-dioicae]
MYGCGTNCSPVLAQPCGVESRRSLHNARGPAPIHSGITMLASILEPADQFISYKMAETIKHDIMTLRPPWRTASTTSLCVPMAKVRA